MKDTPKRYIMTPTYRYKQVPGPSPQHIRYRYLCNACILLLAGKLSKTVATLLIICNPQRPITSPTVMFREYVRSMPVILLESSAEARSTTPCAETDDIFTLTRRMVSAGRAPPDPAAPPAPCSQPATALSINHTYNSIFAKI